METTLINRIRLLQLHILTEFLRHFGTDVESRSMEIGSLLSLLLEETSAMQGIKALRYFNAEVYTIHDISGYPPAVKTAIVRGLNEAGGNYRFMANGRSEPLPAIIGCDYIEVTVPTKDPIGLLEAKRMRDLLRSMKTD